MTIFALSTVEGHSGVAIIRVSGPKAKKTIKLLTGKNTKPRQATLTNISTRKNELIDKGLVIYFPKENSFTGEEVAEYHLHGSPAVANLLLSELDKIQGLRHAKPGEFTKQAFLNDKMNILQVEGLSNLIKSETETQRNQSLKQYLKESTEIYFDWLEGLKTVLALVETSIDFSDEDIPKSLIMDAKRKTKKVISKIRDHKKTFKQGKAINEGLKIAIIGKPNSGKSTLINYLSRKKIAIVSKEAGTTRDIITNKVDFNGIPVTFYDTAGLRKTKNEIEEEGKKMAIELSKTADLRIFIGSNNTKKPFKGVDVPKEKGDLIVINKCDLKKAHKEKPNITISLKDKIGLKGLNSKISKRIKGLSNQYSGQVISSERVYGHVCNSLSYLEEINFKDPSLASECLKSSINEISMISKETNNEEILDIIFNEFCIGK